MLSVVGTRSAGAVDNASGVATVLGAAWLIGADDRVGVLITDAEELGLAGARAWTRSRTGRTALNCDGVDDDGPLTIMYSGSAPETLVKAARGAAKAEGQPIRVMRLIPGILADSVAFTAAGWRSVTLSRGTLRTLRRIHTSADSLDRMRGTGIAPTARVLALAAKELC
jgi:Zn-dependent M28 family amino/carboxypeptidase